MYKGIKVIRLVPDVPGRGGIKVGTHSFQKTQVLDTLNLVDGIVRYGAWQIAPKIDSTVLATMPSSFDETVPLRDSSHARVLAMHVFKKYPSNPTQAPTEEIIIHCDTNSSANSTMIHDMTVDPWGGGIRTITAFDEVCESAKFVTVKNRLFYTVGTYQCGIYAGPKSDVIIGSRGGYPPSTDPRPPHYVLGISQPSTPPSLKLAKALTGTPFRYYAGKNRLFIVSPDVDSPIAKFTAVAPTTVDVENPEFPGTYLTRTIGGTGGITGQTSTVAWNTGPFVLPFSGMRVQPRKNDGTPDWYPGFQMLKPYINLDDDISNGGGNDVEAYIGARFKFPANNSSTKLKGVVIDIVGGYVWDFAAGGGTGAAVAKAGKSYLTLDVPISTFEGLNPDPTYPEEFVMEGSTCDITATTHATLRSINLKGIYTAFGTTSYTVPAGVRYAYAWYDPITGHISNISPVTTDVNLTISGDDVAIDLESIEYPPTQDALRFTHILFFRSLRSGGSSLFVVGSLNPDDIGKFHGITSTATNASGVVKCIAKASIADAETVTISDGVVSNVFEFDTTGAFTPGNIQVNISTDTTAIQVAARLAAAVNGVAGFNVTASIPSTPDGRVLLLNDVPGASGIVPITETVADPTFTVTGMDYPAYWIDTFPDTDLLISGALRAPQFTNGKPILRDKGITQVLGPSQIAYWDGRVWLYSQGHVTAIHFSCDQVQCPFGVPEESFPETNVLQIPADDGRVTAMRVIGDKLLICTDRWAYIVVGSNETNYRLLKVSNWLSSVAYYQMCEVAGESEIDPALVCFLAPDRRIYAMSLGQEPICISSQIQPIIDNYFDFNKAGLGFGGTYRSLRLHSSVIGGKRLLVLWSINWPKPNTDASLVLIYDFEQKIWVEWTPVDNSMAGSKRWLGPIASSFGGTLATSTIERRDLVVVPDRSAYTEVYLRSWFDITEGSAASTFAVTTFPASFDVDDFNGKRRKVLQYIKAYVSNAETLSGVITVVSGALMNNHGYFTLNDGTVSYVFEYLSSGSATAGRVVIPFTGAETAAQMRDLTITAINASGILCVASIRSSTAIDLTMKNGFVGGANSETVTDAGFTITGMGAPPWNVDLYVDGYAVKNAPMFMPADGFNQFNDYTGVSAYQWEAGSTVRELVAYGPQFNTDKAVLNFYKMAAKIKCSAPSTRNYVYAIEIGFNYANENGASDP